jgi:hypothetical protein
VVILLMVVGGFINSYWWLTTIDGYSIGGY